MSTQLPPRDGNTPPPAPGFLLADVEVLRSTFLAEYPTLSAEASQALGPEAAGLSPKVVEGAFAAQMNTDQIFESYNTLGQRYNPTLVSREKIPPGKIVDRMVAVSVNLPAAAVESRKKLVLKIEEMNRMITELVESPK